MSTDLEEPPRRSKLERLREFLRWAPDIVRLIHALLSLHNGRGPW